MAQTIWIHKLADAKKAEADGMDYICEHLFQGLTQAGKLTKAKWLEPLTKCKRERWNHMPGAVLRFIRKELQQWQCETRERPGTGVAKSSGARPTRSFEKRMTDPDKQAAFVSGLRKIAEEAAAKNPTLADMRALAKTLVTETRKRIANGEPFSPLGAHFAVCPTRRLSNRCTQQASEGWRWRRSPTTATRGRMSPWRRFAK